jgi:hypothetical protein
MKTISNKIEPHNIMRVLPRYFNVKRMTTSLNISILLFLTFLLSCRSSTKQITMQIVNDVVIDDTSNIVFPFSSSKNTSFEQKCSIDTASILYNQNLPSLIKELENTKLTIYKTTKGIPPVILNFLKCSHDGEFSIANPGENWQVTDVVTEKLPERQLVFIGVADSIALMAHFSGGMGKSEHILIFKFNDKEVTNFWCGMVLTSLSDKQQIVQFLRENMNKDWGLNTNIIYF